MFIFFIQSRSKTFASLDRPELQYTGISHKGFFQNSNKILANIAFIEYRTIDFSSRNFPASSHSLLTSLSSQENVCPFRNGRLMFSLIILTVITQNFIFQGRSDCREAHLSTGSRGVRHPPRPLSQFAPPGSKMTYPPLSQLIIQAIFSGKPSLSTRFHHQPLQ